MDLWSFWEAPEPEKPSKFSVLSFKTEVRQKSIRNAIHRCPGPIFHGFVTALGGIQELLNDTVASLLQVGFSMDFEEDPGLRQRGPEKVIPAFWPYITTSVWLEEYIK